MTKIKGLVSVIVPNHGRDISKLRESIVNSTYKDVEIIEVNLGLERSVQRNFGIDQARGEFLLILDSDQFISQLLIEECVVEMNFADAIYIPEIIISDKLSWFGRLRRWEREFYTGTAVDVVRFVRAENCPKFDETMSGPEDSDWDRRITGRRYIAFNPVYHNDDINIWKYLSKKAYYSKSMRRFAEKWPRDKCLNFWWRCFGVFFEDGKWKKVILRPDLFISVLFIIFLRGIIYLWKR